MTAGSEPSFAALAAAGARLRDAGLTPRALAAWAGTARISALPARLDALPAKLDAERAPPGAAATMTPAGAILALFIAGLDVARRAVRLADDVIDVLAAHGLVARDGDRLRAPVAIVPLAQLGAQGGSLVVCDRLDAAVERDLVCWPDDSSLHLATAIPAGRRADWLDLGCGSAVAPLARPALAARITGVDVNARAVRYARLGAALSGLAQLAVATGDIGDAQPPAALVTCNAPMPELLPIAVASGQHTAWQAASVAEVWRHAEPGFFDRLWPALRRAVQPGGLIVMHAARAAILPVLASAGGERVIVTYTPPEVRGFAVAWWRPDAPDRFIAVDRALTAERPHLEPRDRDDALAQADAPA